MKTRLVEYQDNAVLLEGYLAYDEQFAAKRPTVMVVHDWSGRNEFAQQKAEQLAKLGYIGFAIDIYGKNKTGKTTEEKSKLMNPFIEDRQLLRQRLLAAFNTVKNIDRVDTNKIAIIGFCFGGLAALDLARSGAELRGVVMFHGFFNAPANLANEKIKAKILAFHGMEDPMVPFSQINDFAKEMAAQQVDWQVHIFGNTKHAFTNPLANDPKLGTVYNPVAAERSWQQAELFFQEIFK